MYFPATARPFGPQLKLLYLLIHSLYLFHLRDEFGHGTVARDVGRFLGPGESDVEQTALGGHGCS